MDTPYKRYIPLDTQKQQIYTPNTSYRPPKSLPNYSNTNNINHNIKDIKNGIATSESYLSTNTFLSPTFINHQEISDISNIQQNVNINENISNPFLKILEKKTPPPNKK